MYTINFQDSELQGLLNFLEEQPAKHTRVYLNLIETQIVEQSRKKEASEKLEEPEQEAKKK